MRWPIYTTQHCRGVRRMNRIFKSLVLLVFIGVCFSAKLRFRPLSESNNVLTEISVTDERGTAEVFDGIGGISGGGATSKLLVNYPEKQRNEILDFLFKPDYAASLQILKVEIGGDSQSTDGSEASHMHEPDTENYHSGYEWWMMKEAKKRNPNIKLYGLSWVFPGWLNNGGDHPFGNFTALADYFLKWIKGAKIHHDLDIDYMGIWNERHIDKEFVKFFRKRLDKEGFSHIKVVVPDAMDWSIADRVIEDPEYLKAIDIIGQHYPNATSPQKALNLGKKLWASEDYSSRSSLGGGGCWARVLNEGPVFGHYSAFLAWNLITSYYDHMPYSSCSLMTANQPWSGHYSVDSPIWSSAHHTFFYQPGWKYLPHGSGRGVLKGNGTYITLVSPDQSDMTMVISTLNPKQADCLYNMPQYEVASIQKATFKLEGSLKNIKKLNVWYSFYNYEDEKQSIFFEEHMPLNVIDGKFTLELKKNIIITLTTVKKTKPTNYPGASPPSKRFPMPFSEDFEGMNVGEEPYNFSPQSGAYEVAIADDPKHGKVMTQVVLRPPIDTCWTKMGVPPNLIGDFYWRNVNVKVDAFVDKNDKHATNGVFLASNINHGGCDLVIREGIYFWVNISKGMSELCLNHNCSHSVAVTKLPKNLYNTWFTMSLDVQGTHIKAMIDDDVVFNLIAKELYSNHGFVVLGPNNFGRASFDNFVVSRASLSNDVLLSKSVPKNFNRF